MKKRIPGVMPPLASRVTGTLALVVCLVFAAAGCDRSQPGGHEAKGSTQSVRPNIIFILIDTLRADRLGVYGGPQGNSPELDAVANEGVLFSRAVAQAPWTQPSMASLLCACYPAVHQVLDYDLAFDSAYEGAKKVTVFSESFQTLAEALQDGGYDTAGFVANPFMVREYGFAQGFAHYDTSFADNLAPGSAVNAAAIAWLQQRDPSKPFFLYLHYMDVHGPYDARPEIMEPLLDAVERDPDKRTLSAIEFERLGYLRALPTKSHDQQRHQNLAFYREYWVARYDAGIREVDRSIGRLRRRLKQMGLWQDAYIVVTSDHGEALCEHGMWDHGNSVHHTELHVPLILRWPGVLPAGERVGGTVRLIDVMPTLLEQLQLPAAAHVQGRSLVRLMSDRRPRQAVPAVAEGVKHGPQQQAVYVDDWKLMAVPSTGKKQLFDLTTDALEQSDLSQARPAEVERLTAVLQRENERTAQLAADYETKRVELTAEQEERLRALGYVP